MVHLGTYTKRIECLELVKQAFFFVQKLSRKDMERRLPAVALSPSASEGATICVRVASSVTLQLCCETWTQLAFLDNQMGYTYYIYT